MDMFTNKWLLTIYPNKTYSYMYLGGIFGADEDNQFIEFDTKAEMLQYIENNNLEVQYETE